MNRPAFADRVEALERFLGDPREPTRPLSHASGVALDEEEAFPADACAALERWGYARELVPSAYGGALEGFDRLLSLGRVVARRDLTVAIAIGQTFLGALPVWVEGRDAQRARVAARILEGGAGCLALTEEEHGSDLVAGEVHAERDGGGFLLHGTKWCINNATRGRFASVLARTREGGGARGHSMFFVDEVSASATTVRKLPKLRTHGIRGADIGGLVFDGARLPHDALVGHEGRGLDLALKSLQVSRALCASFSLGAGDTAVRLVLEFAQGRRLYGDSAFAIPVVRRAFSSALADLLTADAVAQIACRAFSAVPEEMSVLSAVAKYLVPTLVGGVIDAMAVVLGARHYLREGPYAAFQKLLRDHAVVGLFDGSTAVNLHALAAHLPRSAGHALDRDGARLFALSDLSTAAAPFRWDALRPSARGQDTVMAGMAALAERAHASGHPDIGSLAASLVSSRDALLADAVAHADAAESRTDDARSFALAERYTRLLGGACALGIWLESRASLEPELAEGAWLVVALSRALGHEAPPSAHEATGRALVSLRDRSRALSLSPLWVAQSGSR